MASISLPRRKPAQPYHLREVRSYTQYDPKRPYGMDLVFEEYGTSRVLIVALDNHEVHRILNWQDEPPVQSKEEAQAVKEAVQTVAQRLMAES